MTQHRCTAYLCMITIVIVNGYFAAVVIFGVNALIKYLPIQKNPPFILNINTWYLRKCVVKVYYYCYGVKTLSWNESFLMTHCYPYGSFSECICLVYLDNGSTL